MLGGAARGLATKQDKTVRGLAWILTSRAAYRCGLTLSGRGDPICS